MPSHRSRCTAQSIRASSIRARPRLRSRRRRTTTATCIAQGRQHLCSFWGMKGTEDIGGGYKVNFKLQGVFNSSNGKFALSDTTGVTAGSTSWRRSASPVRSARSTPDGSSCRWSTRWPIPTSARRSTSAAFWPHGSGMNQAAGWPGTNTNVPIGALYDSNALVYQSPKFYGASARARIRAGRRGGPVSGRHARIGGAQVFELRPESVRRLLQRP